MPDYKILVTFTESDGTPYHDIQQITTAETDTRKVVMEFLKEDYRWCVDFIQNNGRYYSKAARDKFRKTFKVEVLTSLWEGDNTESVKLLEDVFGIGYPKDGE